MPNRTSPRHPTFDYRTCAAYFVTVCAQDRRCLFGTVHWDRMHLNDVGLIVTDEWERSETMREEVLLDAFVVMPTSTTGRFTKRSGVNHLHGIVCLVPPDVDDVSPRGYDLTVGPNPKTAETTTDDGGAHGDAHESVPNDDVGTTGGRVKRGHAASVRIVPTFTVGLRDRVTQFGCSGPASRPNG